MAMLGVFSGKYLNSFSYCMVEEAPEYKNILWTKEGQVMWQSPTFTTAWHGSYSLSSHGTLQIKFHHRGDVDKLRTVNLVEVAPGLWQGRDYRLRLIEMQLLDTFRQAGDGDKLDDGADRDWIKIANPLSPTVGKSDEAGI